MTGSATHIAATKVREKALRIASERMQTPPSDLDIIAGNVVRKGSPTGSPSMSLADIAGAVAPTSRTRGDHEPGLSAEGWFFTDHMVFPYGIHIAVARVDRGTGEVSIERFLVAYDVGRAINPMLIEGQITGGVAQGIGGALYEEFRYDERGQPLAVTFADYLMVSAREMPTVAVLLSEDAPSPRNPLGIKGAGEAGTNAAGAAIAAAIDQAIGVPGAVIQLPVTPQRMHNMLSGMSIRGSG
jgi:carbon-monoxide dehydrogenase large subunit/6-hydroxypseudooxynicotine dehydrogenase subunit gamma